MKKLLMTFSALTGLLILLGLLLTLLWPKPTPTEPPELAQAKLTAQLAELQRQQESAEFWNHFLQFSAMAFVVLVLVAGGVAIYWYSRNSAHAHRIETARLRRSLSLIDADQLGNYPAWLDQQTGEYIRLRPGNSPAPRPPANFILGNSPVAQVKERGRADVPILINNYDRKPPQPGYKVTEVKPGELAEPSYDRTVPANVQGDSVNLENVGTTANVQTDDSERSEPVQNFSEILADLKRRGEGKQVAIEAVTGVKKGGSKAWKAYSDFWDNLP